MRYLIAALIASSGAVDEHEIAVDVIEVNRLYGIDGNEILCQVIFWRDYGRHGVHVVDWATWRSVTVVPERGQWRAIVRKGARSAIVVAPELRRTWTQYDPEVEDRQALPVGQREGLFSGR